LLVGFNTHDDAGVYQLNAELALVTTVDFITPPVDDPELFGEVAAANSLSDVYAMGGTPLTCLSLVSFPSSKLGPEVLAGILKGAQRKIDEAGAVLAGGHSVEDEEPKFGLAVTGTVHPDKIWRNKGAQPGDRLLLTKPFGCGVLFNAIFMGWGWAAARDECLATVSTLNRTAAETLAAYTVHAATDVTGFGLCGHALEIAEASGVTLKIRFDELPVMREAADMYQRGVTTKANEPNHALLGAKLRASRRLEPWEAELLIDPQTNGGLLVALPADEAEAALMALHGKGLTRACVIGEVVEAAETPIEVV
jgi:selenide,water dikinase